MAELVSNTLFIPPGRLAGLVGVSPAAFQLLTTGTTAVSSTFGRVSVLVQLSGSGQLLSAVSLFRNKLEVLQAGLADSSPSAVLAQARDVVAAFNELQGSLDSVQQASGSLTSALADDQISLNLQQLASSAIAAGSSSLADLSVIGLEVQASVSPDSGATSLRLRIDQELLEAAVRANPVGTQARLAEVAQAFLEPLAEFEGQAARVTIAQSNLTLLGNATAGQALDLNGIPGLDSSLLLPDSGAVADLLPVETLLNDLVNGLPPANAALAAAGQEEGGGLPESGVPQASAGTTTLLATASTATAGNLPTSLAADRAASDATLLLQSLTSNPALRAINTSRFDPAYAALIAASHLSDFVLPASENRPGLLPADSPAPVLAVTMARAIGEYNEAARGYQAFGP